MSSTQCGHTYQPATGLAQTNGAHVLIIKQLVNTTVIKSNGKVCVVGRLRNAATSGKVLPHCYDHWHSFTALCLLNY